MLRSVVLLIVVTAGAVAGAAEPDDALAKSAEALVRARVALERGDAEAARRSLDAVTEDLRGVAYRLLRDVAQQADPKAALAGRKAPVPEIRFALAVLHPCKPWAAYLCDQGQVLVYDLSQLGSKPQKIGSPRGKPLMHGGFSADGKVLVAGDTEGGILVWDTKSFKVTGNFSKGSAPVRYVAVNDDGSKLLAETERGVVLLEIATGREIGVVGQRYNFGTALCFSPDGRHCATGGFTSVVVYDANTGQQVRNIDHAPYTMQLCFSPDGQNIASGLRGSLSKWSGVFRVATGEVVFDRAEHGKGVTGLMFLDGGQCLLSTAADGTMKFWHVPSGRELLALKLGPSIYQPSLGADGSLLLWNQRTGPCYYRLK